MVDRFEYELDTTSPHEEWMKVVEANIARERRRSRNRLMTVRPDNRLADSPMVPVACRRCGACVSARKSSWNQTSVQWTAEAQRIVWSDATPQHLAAHSERGLFLGLLSVD